MAKSKNQTAKKNQFKIKVTKDGPYLVTGGVPLSEQNVCVDNDDQCHGWKEGKKYPAQESYALCRCGHSQHKPYCDGSHAKAKFEGKETTNYQTYMEQATEINGPDLRLTDVHDFCVGARFCHRADGPWNLIKQSDNPKAKQTVIEETCDCPSGRLVAWEKNGKAIEPEFEPSIGLVEDTQAKKMGPIWVRGSIPVESVEGKSYEVRNRVTLCRCGKSANKPFCDGSHLK